MNMAGSSDWDMDSDRDDYKYDGDSDLNDSEKEELEVALYSQLYFQSDIDLDYDINKNLNQNRLDNSVSIRTIKPFIGDDPLSAPLSIESSFPVNNVNVDNDAVSFIKSFGVSENTSSTKCAKFSDVSSSKPTLKRKVTKNINDQDSRSDSFKGKSDKLVKKQNRPKKKKNQSDEQVQNVNKSNESIENVVNVSSFNSAVPVTLSSDNGTHPAKDIVMQISSSSSQQLSKSYSSVEICIQDSSDTDSELSCLSEDLSVNVLQSKAQRNDDITLLNVCDSSRIRYHGAGVNIVGDTGETDQADIGRREFDNRTALVIENWSINDDDRFSRNDQSSCGFRGNRYFKSNVRCQNCSETGHMARNCRKPKKALHCILCGLIGHLFPRCPWSICYKCNAPEGHNAANCPMKLPPPWFVTCHRCLAKGHRYKDCPESWRQYHLTTQPGNPKPAKLQVNPRVFCCICAKEGHFHFECIEKTMLGVHAVPHSPFVTKYDQPIPDTNSKTRRASDMENNNDVISSIVEKTKTGTDENTMVRQCDNVTNTDIQSENIPAERMVKVDGDESVGTRSKPIKHRKRKINGCVSDVIVLDKKQTRIDINKGVSEREASRQKGKKKRKLAKSVTTSVVNDRECESALTDKAETVTKNINQKECETETSEIPVKKKKKSKILNNVLSDKGCVDATLLGKKGSTACDINRNVLETEIPAVPVKKKKRKMLPDRELVTDICETAQIASDSIKQKVHKTEVAPSPVKKKKKKLKKTINVEGSNAKLKKKVNSSKAAVKDKEKGKDKTERLKKRKKKTTAPVKTLSVKKVKKSKLSDVNQQDSSVCAKVAVSAISKTNTEIITQTNSLSADEVQLVDLTICDDIIVISDDDKSSDLKKNMNKPKKKVKQKHSNKKSL